jgi:hypothetical protein
MCKLDVVHPVVCVIIVNKLILSNTTILLCLTESTYLLSMCKADRLTLSSAWVTYVWSYTLTPPQWDNLKLHFIHILCSQYIPEDSFFFKYQICINYITIYSRYFIDGKDITY